MVWYAIIAIVISVTVVISTLYDIYFYIYWTCSVDSHHNDVMGYGVLGHDISLCCSYL